MATAQLDLDNSSIEVLSSLLSLGFVKLTVKDSKDSICAAMSSIPRVVKKWGMLRYIKFCNEL